MGNSGVGKSTLIKQYVFDDEPQNEDFLKSTIVAEHYIKDVLIPHYEDN
jgi:GTPase SAR1 family protein